MCSSEYPGYPTQMANEEGFDPPEKIGPEQGTKVHSSSPEQDWVPLLEGLPIISEPAREGTFVLQRHQNKS